MIDFLMTRKYLSTQLTDMSIRSLNTILLLFFVVVAQGQTFDRNDFKNYRIKDGLSYNMINAITQDTYGYLWIATDKGLNRFDGSRFDHFYSDSLSQSLPEDRVFNLKWINDEELGVLTSAGLNIINTRTLQMRNLVIPTDSSKNLAKVNRILDIGTDKKGNIFITTSAGFYHFNNAKLLFRYDHPGKITSSFGWDIVKISDKTLLVSTSEGLYIYNIDTKDWRHPNNNDDPFFRKVATPELRFRVKYADEKIFGIGHRGADLILFDIQKKDSQTITTPPGFSGQANFGGMVFRINDTMLAATSTYKGFYTIHFNKQTSSWLLDSTLYFENDFCTSVLVDRNDRVWIGTSGGLYKQNKTGTRVEQTQIPGEGGAIQKTITGLAVADNKIFAATVFEGIYVFDKKQFVSSSHILLPKKQNYIPQLLKATVDTLLVAGNGFLINAKSLEYKEIYQSKQPGSVIRTLFKGSDNMFYFIRNRIDTLYFKNLLDKSFSAIHLPDLKEIRSATQIAEDIEGNIWLGGFGLLRYNKQLKKIDLHLDSFPFLRTLSNEISSNIVFDKTGRMYFGVHRNGLMVYNIKEKKFAHFTRSDGLPDNIIKALYLHYNTLWIATENGLASYDIDTKKISAYGVADGIPIDPNEHTAFYFDPIDSLLYSASSPMILRFNPYKLKKNTTPPKLFIESVDIVGKESIYHPTESITVPFKNNSLTINLAAINYEDAPLQLFAYRLTKKGNEDWQQLGSQNHIFLDNLPVGKHHLQVKVYIRNQSWPDQVVEVIITVKPPFWKTIWFYLGISLIVAAILYYLHRRRIKHVSQKANIDKQLAETEMKALHAQMNPHFIFNCLNSIREMILNSENEQASLYLSKFARLIRITLNQSAKQFVTLTETVDYLERYLEMERIRSDHFTYTIDISNDLNPDETMVHPMLIQPFIENAIWHGSSHKKNMGINISFIKKGDELVCIVEDNGIGIQQSLKQKENTAHEPSVGIANIKQRISLLNEKYNLQSAVHIEDKLSLRQNSGTGTVVTLHLPIKSNESLWTN